MKKNPVHIILLLAILVGLAGFVYWFTTDPVKDLAVSVPGKDNRQKGNLIEEIIKIGEKFQLFGKASESSFVGTWPRFRGENFDNIVSEKQHLKDNWDAGEPEIKWSVELGEGHAGAAIYKGLVYVMDYDEESREDALRCFSLLDGKEIWRRSYGIHVKRNHGMSRTVPAVTDDYVVTIGPRCQVMCVDRKTGDYLWGIDMVKEYGSVIPQWYTAQCPLIDGNKVILAPAGSKLMIAVDLQTGEKIWECPNDLQYNMSHSSIMPMTLNGEKMYVYSANGGICGISASGDDEGTVRWYSNEWRFSVVAPSPLIFPDGRIFLTAGYGAGGMMIKVIPTGDSYQVDVLAEYKPKDGLACEQQTPVYYNGFVYGILPKDGGAYRNQLVCVSPDDVQKIRWTSGKVSRFGLGPYLIADGKMYILSDDGTLTMIKPDPNQYIQLAHKKLFDGHDAWAPLSISDGLLLLRDSKTMFCLDISE
ncbi:outer membrane protein assembly factor BamB family protein [Mangrovibacterium lignilyticum]|uniref:outer membrane protein assembly factor BamB family protein n=1 Tax=Mangrovibacterium lignilyticum TaxID=2668052 RepID=UPI0013D8AA16|nr:PQQ-binding-like beta-propeller repeat protein [Mangrovibacterium lignilyticum]